MILDTLFIESLSNFVHGLSTAFFLYFGIKLVFFRVTNRPLFILGCLFCLWGVQDLKDLLLYIDTIGDSPYYSTILLSIDMWSVPLCALFLLEILSPGFATLRLYHDRFIRGLYVECRLYGGSLCIGSLVYSREGEEV